MTERNKRLIAISIIFLTTRLALVAIGVISMAVVPMIQGPDYRHLEASPALDMWFRQDAGFYTAISLYGYEWAATKETRADMVFLPLYPMTMRVLNLLMPGADRVKATISGLIISNLTLLLAAFLLYDLVEHYADEKTAGVAVWLLMVAPASIYLSGVYTESLFLCLSLVCFWALRREAFYLAVVAASLAFITRPNGLALYIVLLVYLWQKYRVHRIFKWIAAQLPVATFGSYVLATTVITGVPLAYFSAYNQGWHRSTGSWPWQTLAEYFSGQQVSFWGWRLSWIDLICATAYVILAVIVLVREKDKLLGIFALGTVLLPILSGNLLGQPRYGSAVFPFYLVIARWANRPWRQVLVCGASAILAILYTSRFVTWHWIA